MPRGPALLLLAALLAAGVPLRAEGGAPEPDRWRTALERSLLFPGLGQLYEKQYLKAALFAASEVFCLAGVVVYARRGNEAYRNYRDARTIDDAVRWRSEAERLDRRRNVAIAAAAGVWVLNMVDAFVHARKRYGRGKSVAFHPYYRHESHAYGAGVTCRF